MATPLGPKLWRLPGMLCKSSRTFGDLQKAPHPKVLMQFYIKGDGGSVSKSCPTLATPWTVASQAPLPMEFSRQEYWSGLPFPLPGDLPDPGIEPESLASPALEGGFFTTNTTWAAHIKGGGGGAGGQGVGSKYDCIWFCKLSSLDVFGMR